jgi:hypothetical protein
MSETETIEVKVVQVKGAPKPAIYIVDQHAILEIAEEDGLEGEAAQRAVEDVLMAAEEIDLNALARFVVEQTGVDFADYEDEE